METTRQERCRQTYVFTTDLDHPGRSRIFEEWESQEPLDAHFATPPMAAFQAKLGDLRVIAVRVEKYEVARFGPLR